MRFLADTFGSRERLGDTPDMPGVDRANRGPAGAEFQPPHEPAPAEGCARPLSPPAVLPGGLRAAEERDRRLETASVLRRVPGDAVLTCPRDLDVPDAPLEARLGIAPDAALPVQDGTVVGWNPADPARRPTTVRASPTPPRRPRPPADRPVPART
ncbi:hypothetical protein [Streptomyces prasinopilosus]|uniref:hypothetical protein n=1 Tax=Streptomyces prasinopilosus TaxID=67344 RepID=UPI000AE41490|nr:hypothetical protein [Streptomyces prasinopilosus]